MKRFIYFAVTAAMFLTSTGLMGQKADAGRLEATVTELASDSYLGRGFGTEEGKRAAEYIINSFTENGVQPFLEEGYRQSFMYRNGVLNIQGNNIIGLIPGSDPDLSDEYIIIGAHYDHIGWEIEDGDTVVYNGADDNASGVAGILEIGRILNLKEKKPGRSIILVAFDGEESGLIGSNAFVDNLIEGPEAKLEKDQVKAMFSLDMIGMYTSHQGVDLQGGGLLPELDGLVEKVSQESPIIITKNTSSVPPRTDTSPFGDIGIPSVHLFTGTESPYHKPEDDSDLLDYEGMAQVTDFMTGLAMELSELPDVTKSRLMEAAGKEGGVKHFNPAVTAHLGSSHFNFKDYYAEAKPVIAGAAGLSLETRITQGLALQPEVLYEWSGSKTDAGIMRKHAVTVPVSLILSTPDTDPGVRVFYQLGAYYSYNFAGTEAGTALNLVDDYAGTDYGLVYGFGMVIMNVKVAYIFQSSMIDLSLNDPLNLDARLRTSYFSISYIF